MCANYKPATQDDLITHFGVRQRDSDYKAEPFSGYATPIIRRSTAEASIGQRTTANAIFCIVPHWADLKLARATYNVRADHFVLPVYVSRSEEERRLIS